MFGIRIRLDKSLNSGHLILKTSKHLRALGLLSRFLKEFKICRGKVTSNFLSQHFWKMEKCFPKHYINYSTGWMQNLGVKKRTNVEVLVFSNNLAVRLFFWEKILDVRAQSFRVIRLYRHFSYLVIWPLLWDV